MMFAIIPNLTRKNAAQVTRLICARLDELGAAYSLPLGTEDVFSDTKAEFLPEKELLGGCEAVITVGGDGTIIHSAKKAALYTNEGKEEHYNLNGDRPRQAAEFEAFYRAMTAGDQELCARMLDTSIAVSRVLTVARRSAGVRFPGDRV